MGEREKHEISARPVKMERISTQAHSKYVPLNTFITCPPACETRVQYVTLVSFCFVDIGTYLLRCFRYVLRLFIIQISDECRWKLMLYRVGNIPCTNPTLNLPDSVHKCNRDRKMHLLMQPFFLILAVLLNRRFSGLVPKLFMSQVQRRIAEVLNSSPRPPALHILHVSLC